MLSTQRRGRWIALAAALACGLGGQAWAGPMSGYVGLTSPASRESPAENFSRPEKDGLIRPVSLIPLEKPKSPTLLSGTVYYMVFERDDRDPSDPWGTGIPNFSKLFRAGIDFNGGSSPDLDSRAKYLYLYQVVNHQRTLPPIESMSAKLLVELSEITSWGYFNGLGFASRDGDGDARPLSATHKIDPRTYLSPAPALPASQPLTLARVPTTRGEIEPARDADKGKIVQVHWDALDPATPPDYAMILGSSDFDRHPSFRAIWSGKNAIGKDGRSTVFGFTSQMPPTIEPVRLRTSREAAKEAALARGEGGKAAAGEFADAGSGNKDEGVKLAQLGGGEANGSSMAIPGVEGRVPTPFPVTPASAFDPDRDSAGSRNSGAGLPLAAPPPSPVASSAPANGGFTSGNRSPTNSNGGGSPIIGGGGTSGGFITSTTSQGSGSGTSTVNVDINFDVSQTNQQSQSQFQYQNQSQSQSQGGGACCDGGGGGGSHVVPEPTTILGLALGLPVLLVAYRRSRRRNVPIA